MAKNNSRVREYREAKNWTSADLEKASGVSQPTISLVERGFWGSARVRAAIAKAFNKTVRETFPNVPVAELKRAGQD